MNTRDTLLIQGLPETASERVAATVCRSRLLKAVNELLDETRRQEVKITIGTASQMRNADALPGARVERNGQSRASDDLLVGERARQYQAQKPLYAFEQLVISAQLREDLLSSVEIVRLQQRVFDEWGLRKIEPYPRSALNFHGQPGTGKTFAAHALAQNLGRPILVASYAEIESKFHGDGPKNVAAIFHAAEQQQAILFIDEADSLLSKRLTNVTQGSEQAINSMRSQLLICLEKFSGVVIFATNLVTNYDKAFETRVRHLYFPMPDQQCRRELWQKHLPPELPLGGDVCVDQLATIDELCGRDIKNAVIDTAIRTARHGKNCIAQRDLVDAVERIKVARIALAPPKVPLEEDPIPESLL